MTKIMISGGAGFIGSNFVRYMLSKHRDVEIIGLDLLTYSGRLKILQTHEEWWVSLLKDEYVRLDTPWLDANYILEHNSTKV